MESAAFQLTTSVDRLLRDFGHSARTLFLIRRVGTAIALFVSIALCAALLDRLFAFPRSVRCAAAAIDYLVATIVLLRAIAACVRGINPVAAAIAIENQVNVFDQRLVTVVSDSRSGALLHELREQVESIASRPDARPRVSLRPLLGPWAGALVTLLVLAALWALPRLDMPTLLSRFIYPLADIAPPNTPALVVRPGDTSVVEDRPLNLTAVVQSRTSAEPELHLSDDDRTWTTWPMSRPALTDPAFSFLLPAVGHDLRYFVTVGDVTSPTYTVHLLHIPAVTEYRVQYRNSADRHARPVTFASADGKFEAPPGSAVTVDIVCTEPMRRVLLTGGSAHVEAVPTADPAVWRARLIAGAHDSYAVHLTAATGMTGSGPRLVVQPMIAGAAEPAGYEDQLRVYFQAIKPGR